MGYRKVIKVESRLLSTNDLNHFKNAKKSPSENKVWYFACDEAFCWAVNAEFVLTHLSC